MTLFQHRPDVSTILDFINDSLRALQEANVEPRYIVVGSVSYETLRAAMAQRFRRTEGRFETYQHIAIVLDPFREDEVLILPAPQVCAEGVSPYDLDRPG